MPGEEVKETAVGRRDLFALPPSGMNARRGAAGPQHNRNMAAQQRRPPMNNRRPREEEKKEPSALAQGNFGGDFNLSGT